MTTRTIPLVSYESGSRRMLGYFPVEDEDIEKGMKILLGSPENPEKVAFLNEFATEYTLGVRIRPGETDATKVVPLVMTYSGDRRLVVGVANLRADGTTESVTITDPEIIAHLGVDVDSEAIATIKGTV